MAGMIYEVRAESKGRTHAHGAYRDRDEAETELVSWREQITKVGGKNDRYWIEEIDTDGLWEIPSKPTPRERFHTNVTRVEQSPGHWSTTKIKVLDTIGAGVMASQKDGPGWTGNKTVGEYERNYSMLSTFEPFRQGDRNYALIAPNYTATSVMDLDTGEIIATEPSGVGGFCPVGFYVPDWWDINDGSILPGSTYWDEDDEWPTGDFGFVWGCYWGDDWSWKVQYLDLTEVAKGVVKREERYGYLPLATHVGKLKPKDFIRVNKDGGSESVSFDVEQYYNLSGERRDILDD